MLSYTLFHLGPYKVCFWNIIFLSVIFFIAMLLRRVIHKLLKRYLKSANIRVEGRMVTWLKLLSQSVYLLAAYVAVWSFNLNNEDVMILKSDRGVGQLQNLGNNGFYLLFVVPTTRNA